MMRPFLIFFLSLCVLFSCTDNSLEIIPDNDPPYYGEVSRVLIENYINRIYIDVLGREPLDSEMVADYDLLRNADLAFETRRSLVQRLLTDTTFREGELSYRHAHYQRIYDLSKARYLEGTADAELAEEAGIYRSNAIRDSIAGDIPGYNRNMEIYNRLNRIPFSRERLMNKEITLDSMASFMIFNSVYDFINMNTFNFINATFDDLYHRFPSESEFYEAFDMIEYSQSGTIFGQTGSNKADYVQIVVSTKEFSEGTIIWSYKILLARDPSTAELNAALLDYHANKDLEKVWTDIIITNEYANFD